MVLFRVDDETWNGKEIKIVILLNQVTELIFEKVLGRNQRLVSSDRIKAEKGEKVGLTVLTQILGSYASFPNKCFE